ncbi:hypothetical protein Q1695_012145 [Nippostrongylus brasiliensis]|nr:hypothetical protein Q1695_012145 [Nippostrongylus brasiliensis]
MAAIWRCLRCGGGRGRNRSSRRQPRKSAVFASVLNSQLLRRVWALKWPGPCCQAMFSVSRFRFKRMDRKRLVDAMSPAYVNSKLLHHLQ